MKFPLDYACNDEIWIFELRNEYLFVFVLYWALIEKKIVVYSSILVRNFWCD